MKLLEKIIAFDFNLDNYEIKNQYSAEKDTLFNFASNSDTRLSYKEKVNLKSKDLKEKILNDLR